MDEMNQKTMRRSVARMLLWSTLAFFVLLGGGLFLHARMPQMGLSGLQGLGELHRDLVAPVRRQQRRGGWPGAWTTRLWLRAIAPSAIMPTRFP